MTNTEYAQDIGNRGKNAAASAFHRPQTSPDAQTEYGGFFGKRTKEKRSSAPGKGENRRMQKSGRRQGSDRAQKPSKTLFTFVFPLAATLCAALLFLFDRENAASHFSAGARLIAQRVLPSVFPFLVITGFFCRSGLAREAGRRFLAPLARLYRLPSACAPVILIGLVSGFPLGAGSALELYRSGACHKEDAERLIAFCNFCAPPYILGAVGFGIFSSRRVGWLLYLAQTVFALCFGFFYRRPKKRISETPVFIGARENAFSLLSESVSGAGGQMLSIASYVLFFFALSSSVRSLFPSLFAKHALAAPLFSGFLELSSGMAQICGAGLPELAAAALLLGFSGVSVFMQTASFACGEGLSMRGYLTAHLLCPFFTVPFCLFFARFVFGMR